MTLILAQRPNGSWWLDDEDAEPVHGPFLARDAAMQFARRCGITVQVDRD